MPDEAQKIEHLTHAFSIRFIECNKLVCKNMFNCAEKTIEVFAYAVILLNTSIHNPNVKPSEKMKFEQFVKMTKGIDNGSDIDEDYLHGVYERVKQNEFKPGKDHTSSVIEFEKNLVDAKKPTTLFALPHRRLVCIVAIRS
ncbi:IQ motif and Sec7 domain-containing, partial [Brachionus plicatilis]